MIHKLRTTPIARALARPGFSLAELLVVMGVLVLLIAASVPAVRALASSSNQTRAESSLRRALVLASAEASRRSRGEDTLAAFVHTRGQGVSVITMVRVGELIDTIGTSSSQVRREVFVPVPRVPVTELPEGWWVLGHAPQGSIDSLEPASGSAAPSGWYSTSNYATSRNQWVFPETDVYAKSSDWLASPTTIAGDDGRDRQTFVVRFEGSTGRRVVDRPSSVLLVLPSPANEFRNSSPWNIAGVTLGSSEPVETVVRRILQPGPIGTGNVILTENDRRDLLGDRATDTVLARPVSLLALLESRRLLSELDGLRFSRWTGCHYADDDSPTLDASAFASSPSPTAIAARISDWIERASPIAGVANDSIEYEARLFTVGTTAGDMTEFFPLQ